MAETARPTPPAEPNKAALLLIAALSAGVGMLPYLLLIDRLDFLRWVVPGSALLAYFGLRGFQTEARVQPTAAEWLLGAWSAVGFPATAALVGLLFYGIGFGLQHLLALALQAFGQAPLGDPSVWGLRGSVWFVAIAALIAPTLRLPEVARQLYPREAWSRTAFYPLLARRRLLALGALALVVSMGVLVWALDRRGVALPILASLLLFYSSFPLADLGKITPDLAHDRLVSQVDGLLRQQGYAVQREPRTGKPEADPLLQSVDLLARGPAQGFAIEVQSMSSAAPVEWQAANAVRTAAVLLSDEPGADGASPVPVQALLLLVGGTVAQSLADFSQREGVSLVHLDQAAVADGALDDLATLSRQLQAAGLPLPAAPAERQAP